MKGKVVAIFDDEPDIREVLEYNLSREGFQVVSFESPLHGYDFIVKHVPDIILSDWLMPDMDGLEFCQLVKSDRSLRNIPLIMISCKSDDSDIHAAFESGADDYLTKPFRVRELIARMNRVMNANCQPKSS